MTKLRVEKCYLKGKLVDVYKITKPIGKFRKDGNFNSEVVEEVFDFAFDMTFGGKGEHRGTRSGGDLLRSNLEKFVDAFQGKLAEFAVYEQMNLKGIKFHKPDLNTYGLGDWDDADFDYNGHKISVKSTKFFGQLLLLETKDWNQEGEYIPNKSRNNSNSVYDFFIMVRIKPDIIKVIKDTGCLDKDELEDKSTEEFNNQITKEKEILKKHFIENADFEYEFTGAVSNKTLKHIIKNKYIISKGAYLGSLNTKVDAENYYIQLGDFKSIQELIKKLI